MGAIHRNVATLRQEIRAAVCSNWTGRSVSLLLAVVFCGCFPETSEPDPSTRCGSGACSDTELCVSWASPPFEECAEACDLGTTCADGCPCVPLPSGAGACADSCRAWQNCLDSCWSPTMSWGCMPATPGSCDSIYEKLACEIACDEEFHCARCGGPADRCAEAGFSRCDCPDEHGFPCHDPRSFSECTGSPEIAAAITPFASTLQTASVALVDEAGTLLVDVHGGTASGPVTPESRFRIASLTKSFVAALIMLLVEEGLVGLDAPAAAYGVDIPSSVSVRELLTHTSGLVVDHDGDARTSPVDYVWFLQDEEVQGMPHAPARLVDLGTPPTLVEPGSFAYSNTNYVALGMIAEEVTGHSLGPILATRLFRPLDLDSMYLDGSVVGEPPVPGVYQTESGFVPGEGYFHPANAWAAGAVVATAEDLVQWLRALVVEGRVLSDASLAQMLDAGGDNGYGFGLYVSADRTRVWHTGRYPRAGCTAFGASTTTGRTVAVLTNTVDGMSTCLAAEEIAKRLMGW